MQYSRAEKFYALGISRFRYVDLCGLGMSLCCLSMLSITFSLMTYYALHTTGLDPVPTDDVGVNDVVSVLHYVSSFNICM